MLQFVVSYWQAVAPSFVVGFYLLHLLRQHRAANARRVAPAPIEIER